MAHCSVTDIAIWVPNISSIRKTFLLRHLWIYQLTIERIMDSLEMYSLYLSVQWIHIEVGGSTSFCEEGRRGKR